LREVGKVDILQHLDVFNVLQHQYLCDDREARHALFYVLMGQVLEKANDAPDLFVQHDPPNQVEFLWANALLNEQCGGLSQLIHELLERLGGQLTAPLPHTDLHKALELLREPNLALVY